MHLLITIPFLLLILNCKGTVKNESGSAEEEIKAEEMYLEAVGTLTETINCKFYCNQNSTEMLIDQGYIVVGASFKSEENIPYGEKNPFEPKKGLKSVLFIHFQPDFEKIENGDCPSSNLVIFLEIESIEDSAWRDISKNIQFALFTGGPFYKFETKGETKGEIKITEAGEGVVDVKLKLEFGLVEENITGVELDSKLTVINQ